LAKALGGSGAADEAAEILDEAYRQAPRSANVVSAVVKARRAVAPRSPRLAEELSDLAGLYLDEGKPKLARVCLDEADEFSTPSPERLVLRERVARLTPASEALESSGALQDDADTMRAEREEAINTFLVVLRFDPDNLDVHRQLANLYGQIGEPDGEIRHYDAVIRLLEKKADWRGMIDLLPTLTRRFPKHAPFQEATQRARLQIRALHLLEDDMTQTSFGEIPPE
jgi:tetratricopeptide (TPR) repeat protein